MCYISHDTIFHTHSCLLGYIPTITMQISFDGVSGSSTVKTDACTETSDSCSLSFKWLVKDRRAYGVCPPSDIFKREHYKTRYLQHHSSPQKTGEATEAPDNSERQQDPIDGVLMEATYLVHCGDSRYAIMKLYVAVRAKRPKLVTGTSLGTKHVHT